MLPSECLACRLHSHLWQLFRLRKTSSSCGSCKHRKVTAKCELLLLLPGSYIASRVVLAPGGWAGPPMLKQLFGLSVKLDVVKTVVNYFK